LRIARELHDTLLQSFQGVVLKVSSLKYMIPDRPAEAVESLEGMLEQARETIIEGRDSVQGLRSSTVVANDLARASQASGKGWLPIKPARIVPSFVWASKGDRGTSLRSSGTKLTTLLASRYAMRSNRRARSGSKCISGMTNGSSGYKSWATERVSTRRF
jgi:hypothetical protein